MSARVKTFKRCPVLTLKDDIAYLSFGLNKALLILEHLDAIKEFIRSGGEFCESGEVSGLPSKAAAEISK